MSEISEKAIKLIKDLRRDISLNIMFTPTKNAEDESLKALVDYIAELEAERDQAKSVVSRLRDFLFDYTNLRISTSQDDRWWALVDKFDEITKLPEVQE